MSTTKDDISVVISALHAVQFIRDHYASTQEGAKRIDDIVTMLAAQDKGRGQHGGIRKNIAEAISKAYLNRPLAS